MKTKLLLIAFWLITVGNIQAQITFHKNYSAKGEWRCFHQTKDGGYIITGSPNGFVHAGGTDFYLIKTNSLGDTLWTKIYGGQFDDDANSVFETDDGGYIIAGETRSFGFGGTWDILLIKTDSIGNLIWSKTYGGVVDDYGYTVEQTRDGGYFITGFSSSFGFVGYIYIIKTDNNGDLSWSKVFKRNGYSYSLAAHQTFDGGYIFGGYTTGGDIGQEDIYLIKTDSIGNLLWSKLYGGAKSDIANDIQQTADSGYIVTGGSSSFSPYTGIYLIKTDSNGNLLWSKTYKGLGTEGSKSVAQTSDGGYIVAGTTAKSGFGNPFYFYLIKTDQYGNQLWSKLINSVYNNYYSYSIEQTKDGGYAIAADDINYIYLIKTDSLGNSGCNDSSIVTTTNIPATQVVTPSTTFADVNDSTITTNPVPIINIGGIVSTVCISVNIVEIKNENNILIYPNPLTSSSILQLNTQLKSAEVVIYDMVGKEMMRKKFSPSNPSFGGLTGERMEIEKGSLQSGVYFVKVMSEERQWVEKMVVE